MRHAFKTKAEITFSLRRKFAITCIGQPSAARNVPPGLLTSDRPLWQIGWSRTVREHVDKNRTVLPAQFCLCGGEYASACERRRRWCAVVIEAIACRLRNAILAPGDGPRERQQAYRRGKGTQEITLYEQSGLHADMPPLMLATIAYRQQYDRLRAAEMKQRLRRRCRTVSGIHGFFLDATSW
jgi:hypothetical protein